MEDEDGVKIEDEEAIKVEDEDGKDFSKDDDDEIQNSELEEEHSREFDDENSSEEIPTKSLYGGADEEFPSDPQEVKSNRLDAIVKRRIRNSIDFPFVTNHILKICPYRAKRSMFSKISSLAFLKALYYT